MRSMAAEDTFSANFIASSYVDAALKYELPGLSFWHADNFIKLHFKRSKIIIIYGTIFLIVAPISTTRYLLQELLAICLRDWSLPTSRAACYLARGLLSFLLRDSYLPKEAARYLDQGLLIFELSPVSLNPQPQLCIGACRHFKTSGAPEGINLLFL